jgi:hypothetical protein
MDTLLFFYENCRALSTRPGAKIKAAEPRLSARGGALALNWQSPFVPLFPFVPLIFFYDGIFLARAARIAFEIH